MSPQNANEWPTLATLPRFAEPPPMSDEPVGLDKIMTSRFALPPPPQTLLAADAPRSELDK
jgi:hypothetical protein